VLLINLGTPDAPETAPVREYLREFLMDPYVIDIPGPLRWLMVNLLILPRRPAQSAAAYRKIWSGEGSPLLFHTRALTERLRERIPEMHRIEFGMRYGQPSIRSAIESLLSSGIDRLIVIPLYPQYSLAATESSITEVKRVLRALGSSIPLQIPREFHTHRGFITAFAEVGRARLAEFRPDHALFSFHGLPERQILRTDPSGAHCLKDSSCCDAVGERNRQCYRAQAHATARAIALELKLAPSHYSVSFQSRLGRTPWIRPYTDIRFGELVKSGVKRLAVFCPAFVADCLETLEEIQIRGREQFRSLGGEELLLIPSLNSEPAWVRAVAELVREAESLSPEETTGTPSRSQSGSTPQEEARPG
jgi:ferrochelatase